MPVEVKRRKIAVLGARSVGEQRPPSSSVKQFVEKQFIDSYYPTIERAYVKSIIYKGNEYVLEIFDTAGQDEFSPLKAQYAIGIHGYVLVYSIASSNSFEMVQILHDKIIDYCGVTDIPCVIVGAKSDLHSNRQVQFSELERVAEANNAACVETSAKDDVNVGRVFQLCVQEIERRLSNNQAVPQANRCLLQ
ncbi:small GTPase superfamily [Lentinula guzmanii]|uniref:Small GTPase superfamily n=1 Tax=Lentinula guzmanii TaxID=2804957 RepID=A0AA38MZ97_9AGAR|nr:small GTPase superfamily [Lentinula guzmanii]